MTSATPTSETQPRTNAGFVLNTHANEWGQITGLEPGAAYLVVRRPTGEQARARTQDLLGQVRSYLENNKAVGEERMRKFDERVAQPAKAKAREIRETLEKRFDEIAHEVEHRFEQLEKDLAERGILKGRGEGAQDQSVETVETPGEMPRGDHQEPPKPSGGPTTSTPRKKPASKKSD